MTEEITSFAPDLVTSSHPVYLAHKPIYEAKFKRWDELKSAKQDLSKEAVLMLRDPSIYAYAFFKGTDGLPFKVTDYQDLILNQKHDYSPDGINRYVLFIAANQVGKSEALCIIALHTVLLEDNVTVAIVSKSLPQSQAVLQRIKLILNNSVFGQSWKEDIGDQANTTILTFSRNGGKSVSKIICAPAGEGLLGYPVHKLLLDEADFYDDAKNFFYKVAMPRTNQTKGQIILFSNPNPDISRSMSLLYELVQGDLFRKKFKFTFMDAPWNTLAEYERNRKNTPGHIFGSTHDGMFSQDAGSFFSQAELDRMFKRDWENSLPLVDKPVYIGLDFGQQVDNSVLTLGVPFEEDGVIKLDVRFIEVFPLKTPYTVILGRLKEICDYYTLNFHGVEGVAFDKSGVGGSMSEFASLEKSIYITDVVWSLERKTKLYADFKLMAENNRLKIVYTDDAYKQLSELTFKTTPRGYVTVDNSKASVHDDIPASICMLVSVVLGRGSVTPGFSFIGVSKEVKGKDVNDNWTHELSDDDLGEIEEVGRLRNNGF